MMPLEFGQNAYKKPTVLSHWYDDENDPDALLRVYGNAEHPTPYYQYPVFNRNDKNELVKASHAEDFQQYKIEFDILIERAKEIAAGNEQHIKIIDAFSEQLLCGFNGITTTKFATQCDPVLFADMKYYIETILNKILQDVNLSKGTFQRFIDAISVCEGGAFADLKIIATEISSQKGVFAVLNQYRERLVNAIAQEHYLKHKEYFDDEENEMIQTHINTFMQRLFSLTGKICKPSLNDINIPKIEISQGSVTFSSYVEAEIALHYVITNDELDSFQISFNEENTCENNCLSVKNHLEETIITIFHRYEERLKSILRCSSLSYEAYLATLPVNSHDKTKESLDDAKNDCIMDIKSLLRSFDAPDTAYHLFVNDEFASPNKPLTLKPVAERQFWCASVAAHSVKCNQIILGFHGNTLIESDNKSLQWLEDAEGNFVTPYDFISFFPDSFKNIIQKASSKTFLNSFRDAIHLYRFVMQDENAFESELMMISQRYFMKPGFLENNTDSLLAQAIQADNVAEMERLLSQPDASKFLTAHNIINDVIGRAFWKDDVQPHLVELLLLACPDAKSALSVEEERVLLEWAFAQKSQLLSLEPFDTLLKHPLFPQFQQRCTLDELYDILRVDPKSLHGYILMAKTRADNTR